MMSSRTLSRLARLLGILAVGWAGASAQSGGRADQAQPANQNQVEARAQAWETKFAQQDYAPTDPLEKALYEYFKRLGTEVGQAAGVDLDFSRIAGVARRVLAPETERMIGLFVDAGYSRTDAERYFQLVFDRTQRELGAYFNRTNESARKLVKELEAPTADEQLKKAEKLYMALNYVEALKTLENVLRFAPADVRLTLETALRQQAVGQLADARQNFDLARGLYPRLMSYYLVMGEARAGARDYYGAINDFNVALSLQPDAVNIYSSRGNARLALGDYEGAIDDFGLQIATGSRWRLDAVYLRRSSAYFLQGNLEMAQADVESALRLAPRSSEAYRCLGIIYQRQEKHELALKSFTQSLEIRPDNFSALGSRAWTYYYLNQPGLAMDDARRQADLDPALSGTAMTRAVLHDALDEFHQAETQYLRIIDAAQRRGDRRRWCYAQYQLDMMLRRLKRSERDYLHDVMDWPDDWPKRIGLFLAGRIDGTSLLKAAEQEPDREQRRNHICEANYYVGMTLWNDGRRAEAVPYLEEASRQKYSGNYEYTLARKALKVARERL